MRHAGRAVAAIIVAQPLSPGVAAAQAAIAFAPAEGVTYRLRTTETRNDGATIHRFAVDRTIRFRRDGDAFVAEMIVQPSTPAISGGGARAMFDTVYAALAGIPTRARFDRSGALIGVDDADALWTRMTAAIRDMGGEGTPDRTASALAQALGALPAERRTAMLTSALTGVIAAGAAPPAVGVTRAVTVSAAPFGGGAASLPGVETASATDGAIRVIVRAHGAVSAPGAPEATVTLLRTRDIDTRTGLVIATREKTSTTLTIDGAQRVSTDVLEISLTPLVL